MRAMQLDGDVAFTPTTFPRPVPNGGLNVHTHTTYSDAGTKLTAGAAQLRQRHQGQSQLDAEVRQASIAGTRRWSRRWRLAEASWSARARRRPPGRAGRRPAAASWRSTPLTGTRPPPATSRVCCSRASRRRARSIVRTRPRTPGQHQRAPGRPLATNPSSTTPGGASPPPSIRAASGSFHEHPAGRPLRDFNVTSARVATDQPDGYQGQLHQGQVHHDGGRHPEEVEPEDDVQLQHRHPRDPGGQLQDGSLT